MAGLATVLGNTAGFVVVVFAVALGVGTIIERSVVVFTTIKSIGGVYLVYLGIQTIRHRESLSESFTVTRKPPTTHRLLKEAFVVGISNPKTAIFFVAILPQFVARGAGDLPAQLLVLGSIFCGMALVFDSLWVLGGAKARSWFARSPKQLEVVGGVGGAVIVGIGAALLVTGRNN